MMAYPRCPATGKVMFPSIERGDMEAKRLNAKKRNKQRWKGKCHAFTCTACGGVHVGSKKLGEKRLENV